MPKLKSRKEEKKQWYLKNKDKISKKNKENYNPILKKEYNQDYYKKNKDSLIKQAREYTLNNLNKTKEYQKQYRSENKENRKIYANSNREHINNGLRILRQEKRNNDGAYRFRQNMGSLLSVILKNPSWQIVSKVEEYLGCSIYEFKNHIENQFTEEMSWENYGNFWELDHIKPCSSFNLNNEEERKNCFNVLNTRPLKVSENRIKGGLIYNEIKVF